MDHRMDLDPCDLCIDGGPLRGPVRSLGAQGAGTASCGAPSGTSLAYLSRMDESPVAVSTREPSIFLISLHIVMWTTLTCGMVMVMVVYMLN
jgi:hypothetical protein